MMRKKIRMQYYLKYVSNPVLGKSQNIPKLSVQMAKWVFDNSVLKVDWEFCKWKPLDGVARSSSGLNGKHPVHLDQPPKA